ncbi:Protein O-linked-mannose beta-1,2-N-acetylglucosaminyltransferase 1 [Halocaridina rubra]|uniref:Protein O-linked-mannose beta-1,2-N-acetylglucosaminyltransferase 1 n=1 Tax=Halocaridina rubra TaxID=373956 RepID=A0AAN9A724_HALRR
MSIVSYIRRRIFGKAAPLMKRVVLPCIAILFFVQAFFGRKSPQESPEIPNLIVPGEAIDPILKQTMGRHAYHNLESDPPKEPVLPQPSPVLKKNQEKLLHHQKHTSDDKHKDVPKSKGETGNSNSPSGAQKENKAKGDRGEVPRQAPAPWSMATANITDSHKVRFKGHAITNQTVTLTLMSSSDKVFMSLNKREIYRNLGDRGIHLVVLNQHSGRVMAKRVFDTFTTGTEEEMAEFIDEIQDGRILVFAVLDECSKGLTWRGRNKLKELGARWADKLAYRDMWALVTRKGALKLAETYSNVATADTGYEWGGPVFLRTDFDLEEKPKECSWPTNERNDARRVFCRLYEGYGAMCDCDVTEWSDVFFQADDQLDKQLSLKPLYKDLGIAILATNRSHYLYKTLKSLWEAPGINRDRVVVYADKHNREMIAVTKLFGVQMVVSPDLGNTTAQKIRHKIQRIFRDLMGAKFPKETIPEGGLPEDTIPPFMCDKLLLLEDDLQVSIDAFKYFHALSPLLDRDPTVLGITAFNFFGYRDVANSLVTFYRTAEVNNLAILLSSRIVHDHIVPNWVEAESKREWYRALKMALKDLKNGAIIYPEVPRARHFAYAGQTISGGVQHNLFRDHVLALTTDYDLSDADILQLEASQYEVKLLETLKASNPISFDFCKHDLLYDSTPLVMYVDFNGSWSDEKSWSYVMKCLRTWELYPEAGWKGVWQFHYHGHWLSIVGSPFSTYSYLKPDEYKVITAPPTTTTTTTTSSPSSNTSKKSSSTPDPGTNSNSPKS